MTSVQILLGATHPMNFFSGCIRTPGFLEVGAYANTNNYNKGDGRIYELYKVKCRNWQ